MTTNGKNGSWIIFSLLYIHTQQLSHSAHINRLVLVALAPRPSLRPPSATIGNGPSPHRHPHSVVFPLRACGQITRESEPIPSITALRRARRAADYFWDFIDGRRSILRACGTPQNINRARDFQNARGDLSSGASPLSKLYCWEMISPQCLAHSADSFLGLSRRRMARAWMCFWKASSLISSKDFSMVQRNASTRLSR